MHILICRALGQAVCITYKHTRYASLTPEATDWFRKRDRHPKTPSHQSFYPGLVRAMDPEKMAKLVELAKVSGAAARRLAEHQAKAAAAAPSEPTGAIAVGMAATPQGRTPRRLPLVLLGEQPRPPRVQARPPRVQARPLVPLRVQPGPSTARRSPKEMPRQLRDRQQMLMAPRVQALRKPRVRPLALRRPRVRPLVALPPLSRHGGICRGSPLLLRTRPTQGPQQAWPGTSTTTAWRST